MARAPGISRKLVLPVPPEKYDPRDQRELRRILEENSQQPADFSAVISTPAPVTALGGLTGAADTVPYFTSVSAMALAALTPYARTILACAAAADARTVLGLGSIALLNSVTEADLSLSDVTTKDASTTQHGFAPKGTNTGTHFLRDDLTWAVPAGGSGSLPSWLSLHPDAPPSTADAMDDEFGDALSQSGPVNGLASKWGWVNQGAASLSFVHDAALIALPAGSGDNVRVLAQTIAAPTGNYAFRTKCAVYAPTDTSFFGVGLALRESATGKMMINYIARTGGTPARKIGGIYSYNSPTSFNTVVNNGLDALSVVLMNAYLEIEKSGTTLTFRVSLDGLGYFTMMSEAENSHFTTRPDQIALIANDTSSSLTASAAWHWVRKVA